MHMKYNNTVFYIEKYKNIHKINKNYYINVLKLF